MKATTDGTGFRNGEILTLVAKASGAFWKAQNRGGQEVMILPMDAQLFDRGAQVAAERRASPRSGGGGGGGGGSGANKDYINLPNPGGGGRGAHDYINLPKGGVPGARGSGGAGGAAGPRVSKALDYVNLGNMSSSVAGASERENAMDLW